MTDRLITQRNSSPAVKASHRDATQYEHHGAWPHTIGPVSLAVLVFAGQLKASPMLAWVPVDLTLLSAAMVTICCAAAVFRRLPTRSGVAPTLLVLGILVASIRPDLSSEYGITKAVLLVTITALLMLSPLLLIPDTPSLKTFIVSLSSIALLVGASVLIAPGSVARYTNRITFGEADTIGTARVIGTGFVVVAVTLALGYSRKLASTLVGTALAATALLAILLTGSRGPFLAAIIAVVVAIVFGRNGRRRRWTGLVFLTGGAGVVAWWISTSRSDGASRILGFLNGQFDSSTSARSQLWGYSFDEISRSFLGVGLGNFNSLPALDGTPYLYPHNVVLEVFVECGWIPGLVLLGYLILSLARAARRATTHGGVVVFGLLTFALCNSLVSGDVNSNRLLWLVASIAVTCSFRPEAAAASASEALPRSVR